MPYTLKRGADISHYQAEPTQFHESGLDFLMIKSSEGLGVDPTFANRQPRVRAVFAVRGFYHFLRSGDIDAAEQGKHIANAIGPLQANEYFALDIEDGCGLAGATGIEYIRDVLDATGYSDAQIMIYTSLGWARGVFGEPLDQLTRYHLWAARYASELGDTSPWTAALVWQNGENSAVAGIADSGVDSDVWLDGRWPVNGNAL